MTSQPAGTGAASAPNWGVNTDLQFFFASVCVLFLGLVHEIAAVIQGILGQRPGVLQGVLASVVFLSLVWLLISTARALGNGNLTRDNIWEAFKMLGFMGLSTGLTLATAVVILFFSQLSLLWLTGWTPFANILLFFGLLLALQN